MSEVFIHLEEPEQFDLITKYAKVCVVDFFTEWCDPCKQLSKTLDVVLSKEYKPNMFLATDKMDAATLRGKLVVLKVDATRFDDISATFGVDCYPYLVFFKDGTLQSDIVKGNDPRKIMSTIKKLYKGGVHPHSHPHPPSRH